MSGQSIKGAIDSFRDINSFLAIGHLSSEPAWVTSKFGFVFAFSMLPLYLCLVADLSTYLRGD
jgi:hypothetical protein